VTHVSGRELTPLFVELDSLAERDRPRLGVGAHRPLLSQLGDVGPGIAVNAHKELQGRPFIQVAAARIEPGEVVPAHGRNGDPQPLEFPWRR